MTKLRAAHCCARFPKYLGGGVLLGLLAAVPGLAVLAAAGYFLLQVFFPQLSGFKVDYALAAFVLGSSLLLVDLALDRPGVSAAPVLLAVWALVVPVLGLYGALLEAFFSTPAWITALAVAGLAALYCGLLVFLLGSKAGRWGLLALTVLLVTIYGFYVAGPQESGGRRFVLHVGLMLAVLGSATAIAQLACDALAADAREGAYVSMGGFVGYSSSWLVAAVLAGAAAARLAGSWWMLLAVGIPFYLVSLALRPWIVRANLGRDLPAPAAAAGGFAALERAAAAARNPGPNPGERPKPLFEIVAHRRDDDTPQGCDSDYEWHVRSVQTGDAIASFSGYWYGYTGRKGGTQSVELIADGEAVVARDEDGTEQRIELPREVRVGADPAQIVLTYRDGRTETRSRNRITLVTRYGQVSRLPLVGVADE